MTEPSREQKPKKKYEWGFVVTILISVAITNFVLPGNLALYHFYFLPVIAAGYLLGMRQAVLGAFLCILIVAALTFTRHSSFNQSFDQFDLYAYISVWGGFLILAGAVVGKLQERLILEYYHIKSLNVTLTEKQKELNVANIHLSEYSEKLEEKVKKRTAELEKLNQALTDAKNEADKANQFKSQFLANMSHEIRTPMNAIIGMSDLVTQSRLPDKEKKYVSIIKNASEALLSLINDILDFSKIEAGKLHFEKITFYLPDVIEEAADMFLLNNDDKEIEFIVDVDPLVQVILLGDPFRLRQVIVNLLSNAFKFTKKGTITFAVAADTEKDPYNNIRVSVSDTGIGISESQMNSLFSPFSQADHSVTRKFGGTGLGLSICKQIVAMMSGRIWVESVVNKGSQFYFTASFDRIDTHTGVRSFPTDSGMKSHNCICNNSFWVD